MRPFARIGRGALTFARTRASSATMILSMCALGACLTQRDLDKPPPGYRAPDPPHLEVRRKKAANGVLVHEWTVLARKGEGAILQGPERTWYASGAKEWEREYDHGSPKGTWRKWHENGQPESETEFAGPDTERPMHFWYDNGQPSAEGPARNGLRCGAWKFWRPDGTPREEGLYVDSRREGPWTVWDDDGRTNHVVHYEKNVLVAGRR